jgi:hypothetical protein
MLATRTLLFSAAIMGCLAGCGPTASSDAPIIQRYRVANCVPPSANPKVPETREWNAALRLNDGSAVLITGAQMVGGRIDVQFVATGRVSVAANEGDYVYPSDVRIDHRTDHLYVKASGLAGGLQHQTWLIDYDLRGQKQVDHRLVADEVLPAECSSR